MQRGHRPGTGGRSESTLTLKKPPVMPLLSMGPYPAQLCCISRDTLNNGSTSTVHIHMDTKRLSLWKVSSPSPNTGDSQAQFTANHPHMPPGLAQFATNHISLCRSFQVAMGQTQAKLILACMTSPPKRHQKNHSQKPASEHTRT